MLNIVSNNSLFEFHKADEIDIWRVVNDGVMGGLSQSQIDWDKKDNTFIFSGNVSMDFDGIAYSLDFETEKDKWTEIEMAVEDFQPTFRGRIYSRYGKIDTNDLQQIGFLIAGKQEGKFHLEVDWIRVIK